VKRPNAYRQVLEEAQKRVTQPEPEPALQLENRITVQPQTGTSERIQEPVQNEEKATEKLTLYLLPRQSDKLDELLMQFKKRTGKRLQRNKLMRMLIDQATLDTLLAEPLR